jgi:hypothetical protein
LKRRKSMTWSKNSEFIWYPINLYCKKIKKEEIKNEEDEAKRVDEEKVTEVENKSKKKEKEKKEAAAVEHQWEHVNKNKVQ